MAGLHASLEGAGLGRASGPAPEAPGPACLCTPILGGGQGARRQDSRPSRGKRRLFQKLLPRRPLSAAVRTACLVFLYLPLFCGCVRLTAPPQRDPAPGACSGRTAGPAEDGLCGASRAPLRADPPAGPNVCLWERTLPAPPRAGGPPVCLGRGRHRCWVQAPAPAVPALTPAAATELCLLGCEVKWGRLWSSSVSLPLTSPRALGSVWLLVGSRE